MGWGRGCGEARRHVPDLRSSSAIGGRAEAGPRGAVLPGGHRLRSPCADGQSAHSVSPYAATALSSTPPRPHTRQSRQGARAEGAEAGQGRAIS